MDRGCRGEDVTKTVLLNVYRCFPGSYSDALPLDNLLRGAVFIGTTPL